MAAEMVLGRYRFDVDTASVASLERTTGYRWSVQERIGGAPSLQFLGAGLDEVELSGAIYPHWRGGSGQVGAMRSSALADEALVLTDGGGAVWGRWAIREVGETRRELDAAGVPRRIDFRLRIARYGPASASASPGPAGLEAPLSGGIGPDGSQVRADFERIQTLPAPLRTQLDERVTAVDRSMELARREDVPLDDALRRTSPDLAADLSARLKAEGLETVPRRLWGPTQLVALLPDVPLEGAA